MKCIPVVFALRAGPFVAADDVSDTVFIVEVGSDFVDGLDPDDGLMVEDLGDGRPPGRLD